MKKLLTTLTVLLLVQVAYPCGNEYGYTMNGRKVHTQYFYISNRMLSFDTLYINKRLKTLNDKIQAGTANYETWSDIALNLMKLGQADSAVKILYPLMLKYPKEYNITANLGTAYELTGQLDSALKYISRGIEINPDSHHGSEWIHKKILEAKIKEELSPDWLDSHLIISLEDIPEWQKEPQLSIVGINHKIAYQVRTRVPFTPAPNKVIANLLITMGDLNKKQGTYENAILAYVHALKFAPSHWKRKITNRIVELNRQKERMVRNHRLPREFVRIMKISKINPDLLVINLPYYSERLDRAQLSRWEKEDSLKMLTLEVDSLRSVGVAFKEAELALSSSQWNSYLYLLAGLVVGILGAMIFMKKKK